MPIASVVALRTPVLPKLAARPRPARRLAVATRANLVSDVGKYLSEAASQIFYPQENDTPWKGSGTPFTGKCDGSGRGATLAVQRAGKPAP